MLSPPLAYHNLSEAVLTQRFRSHLPSQISESFTISPLPEEISSWICQVLQLAASSLMANKKLRLKMSTEAGLATMDGLPCLGRIPIRPLLPCPTPNDIELIARSFLSCVRNFKWCPDGTFGLPHRVAALSAKPQATWLCDFGSISNATPFTTRSAPTSSPTSATC